MTYNDLLLLYARKGLYGEFRNSAFRKYCRRNIGKPIMAKCKSGFLMNTVIGDSVDNQIAVYGLMEKGATRITECLAKESSSFIDIGCNIGYYSCLFGTQNPGKKLLSIDPNPLMIERTKENLNLNNVTNYQILTCGIGDRREILQLNIPRNRHSLSSFAYVPKSGGPSDSIEAEIRPLKEVIHEYQLKTCFVKIDTEGFEYEVFCGCSDESTSNIRFIIFELSTSNLQQTGHSPSKIFSLPLLQHFDAYLVRDSAVGFIEKMLPEHIADGKEVNLNGLLVRKDKESLDALKRSTICIK